MGSAKRGQQVHDRFEPRRVGHPRRRPTTQNMACMFWVAQNQITRPGTWHVLGRRTYDDLEHAMFGVATSLTTQNMACSGSSEVLRPRTCHVLGLSNQSLLGLSNRPLLMCSQIPPRLVQSAPPPSPSHVQSVPSWPVPIFMSNQSHLACPINSTLRWISIEINSYP